MKTQQVETLNYNISVCCTHHARYYSCEYNPNPKSWNPKSKFYSSKSIIPYSQELNVTNSKKKSWCIFVFVFAVFGQRSVHGFYRGGETFADKGRPQKRDGGDVPIAACSLAVWAWVEAKLRYLRISRHRRRVQAGTPKWFNVLGGRGEIEHFFYRATGSWHLGMLHYHPLYWFWSLSSVAYYRKDGVCPCFPGGGKNSSLASPPPLFSRCNRIIPPPNGWTTLIMISNPMARLSVLFGGGAGDQLFVFLSFVCCFERPSRTGGGAPWGLGVYFRPGLTFPCAFFGKALPSTVTFERQVMLFYFLSFFFFFSFIVLRNIYLYIYVYIY